MSTHSNVLEEDWENVDEETRISKIRNAVFLAVGEACMTIL